MPFRFSFPWVVWGWLNMGYKRKASSVKYLRHHIMQEAVISKQDNQQPTYIWQPNHSLVHVFGDLAGCVRLCDHAHNICKLGMNWSVSLYLRWWDLLAQGTDFLDWVIHDLKSARLIFRWRLYNYGRRLWLEVILLMSVLCKRGMPAFN